jgi:hypothetical protein
MSATHAAKGSRQRARRRGRTSATTVGIAISGAIFIVAVSAAFLLRGGSTSPEVVPAAQGADVQDTALQPTGETSDMGYPVVATPGDAAGMVSAGGITVQGANWTLGHVPLNIAVRPMWTLTNTSNAPLRLGEPQAQIRAGCCPGPFVVSQRSLQPGESATMTFELGMGEGMDGWHDMGVYVPVRGADGDEVLELNVTGDWGN